MASAYFLNRSGWDVTVIDRGEIGHGWPHFLPDCKRFLFLTRRASDGPTDEQSGGAARRSGALSLRVGSLDGAPPRSISGLFESAVWYAPPGFLLYLRGGTLMARPFDLRRLEWRDEPSILAQNIEVNGSAQITSQTLNESLVGQSDGASIAIGTPSSPVETLTLRGGAIGSVTRSAGDGGWRHF